MARDRKGSKVYSYVKVGDDANIHSLNIIDKFRAIYGSYMEDSGRTELRNAKNQEALIAEELTLRGDLIAFMSKATDPIRKGTKKDVVLEVAKEFSTVLQDVLNSPAVDNFYNVSIINWPHPEFETIQYVITIKLEAK